jgi:hypothetical protein
MAGAPFAEITQLRGRCDRLFHELRGIGQGGWMPAIGVVRPGDGLVLRVDLPGRASEGTSLVSADCSVTSRPREPASCTGRRIACPGSAP